VRGDRLQHDSPDAILEHGAIEIEQETSTNPTQLHVGQHLCLVDWQEALDCFELENDLILNDDVEAIAAV
jgi:hypothetical protein